MGSAKEDKRAFTIQEISRTFDRQTAPSKISDWAWKIWTKEV